MIAELEKTAVLEPGATCIAHDGSKVVQEDGRCLYAHAFSLVTDSCDIARASERDDDAGILCQMNGRYQTVSHYGNRRTRRALCGVRVPNYGDDAAAPEVECLRCRSLMAKTESDDK